METKMASLSMMLCSTLVLLQTLLWTNVHAHLPMWKNLLVHHREWDGRYVHREDNSTLYNCSLKVASIGPHEDSTSYVYLIADHIQIDMTIFSDNDTTIYLQEEAVWKKVKLFENHTEIMIAGRFVSDHLYYIFIGNVSSAEEENFATLALRPRGHLQTTYHRPTNTHLKYGLVYGIPVTCAAILMVAGLGIICWAVRKGYVRSLSWSYNNFKNPSDEPQPVLEMKSSNEEYTSVA